jgi:NAD(P)-dependent dehydrogenase (short-subunit alcohol dehydrogenase family)
MAKSFLDRGDQVAIVDVDKQAIEKLQSELPQVICFEADVTNETQIQAVFDDLAIRWDSLDVVCANAGIAGPAGAIEDLTLADWKSCLAVNLDGTFLTAQGAAKRFKTQNSGLLILTSSTAGLFGYPYRSPYATAKWGIIGLMKTLAMELGGHNVRVNALCPGAVEGERMDRVIAKEAQARDIDEQAVREMYVKGVSMKTWVKAQDIANMALFLASDAGNKISGQSLTIDGHTETVNP